jgi:SAM-dependent methyltransferase
MPEPDYNWHDHWNRFAGSSTSNPGQRMRFELVGRLLRRMQTESMRLFDIGSGHGDLLTHVRGLFPKAALLGAELSESGVAMTRAKVPDATVIAANLFQPPEEFAKFHDWATHATCSEVLEHVEDPAAFLRAARPYLAKDAALVVTVPGGPMSVFDRQIGHYRHFTKRSVTRVLVESGFAVERVLRSGFPFFNLYRGVVIARGEKLAQDIDGRPSLAASLAMAVFRFLFQFNLTDSPFGWQIVAVARKTKA